MVLPDRAAKDIVPAWLEEERNIRVADGFVVGIILNATGKTFESLPRHAETIGLDDIPTITLKLRGLLFTK